MTALGDLTWPEVADLAPRSVLVVPIGSTEQHGPHLPGTVDTEVAACLAERVAAARPWAVLAPAVPYGSSGEHAGFPGTLSIGHHVVRALVLELVRSADVFAGVLLVSGHGGNAEPLSRAVATAVAEGRSVAVWSPTGPPRDSHAGHTETSVMLAVRPEAVRLDRLERGDTRPLPELMGVLRERGLRPVTANGVLGDPTTASAEAGHRILARWTADLLAAADRFHHAHVGASPTP
ncbi:mycofactocin biosynthesis peptidyl-dipeptidase MftE [Actinosynnema sp. NPDC049800]